MAATDRVDHLDGIRAIAIAAVLSLHWVSWYTPFFHGGSVGVDVFFVLSGFIITTVLWRRRGPEPVGAAWLGFLRRRVVRLYPALVGFVVVTALVYALVPWAPLTPGEVARRGALALGQGSSLWAAGQHGSLYLPGLQPFGQTWSLAVEWYFYLAWPLVVLTARRRWSARRLGALSLGAAVVLYGASLALGSFWFYFGPSARCAELLVGAALALRCADGGPGRGREQGPLVALVALAALALYTVAGRDGQELAYRLVGVPTAVAASVVLIRAGYAERAGLAVRLLRHRWLTAVGRASYSLYLWHLVPFLLLADAPTGLPLPVLGVVAVGCAAASTWLSHRYLERPFVHARGDVLRPVREGRPVATRDPVTLS